MLPFRTEYEFALVVPMGAGEKRMTVTRRRYRWWKLHEEATSVIVHKDHIVTVMDIYCREEAWFHGDVIFAAQRRANRAWSRMVALIPWAVVPTARALPERRR